jgi:hypothetical protein
MRLPRDQRLLEWARRARCSPQQVDLLRSRDVDLSQAARQERAELQDWLEHAFAQARGRDSGHYLASPEVRLLRDYIDAYLDHLEAPLVMVFDEQRDDWVPHNPAAEAQWHSALLREEAWSQGKLAVAEKWRDQLSPELLEVFTLLPPEGMEKLLGHKLDQAPFWEPGLAGLTEREAAALGHQLGMETASNPTAEAQQLWEIRLAMAPQRRRQGEQLTLETIRNYLSSARAKLRNLFGVSRAGPGAQNHSSQRELAAAH